MAQDVGMSDAQVLDRIRSVDVWYHRIEIRPGIITPGVNDSPDTLRHLGLPDDCTGLRVLDLGTRDGFFALEMERRGAQVMAIDYMPAETTGFRVAAELLGSNVEYRQDNIYQVSPERHGMFDIVLCLGLIYHLPDPLGALVIARQVCRDLLFLETHVIDEALLLASGEMVPLSSVDRKLQDLPLAQFYPADALNRDHSNFWGPNMACMRAMLRESNFDVIDETQLGIRGIFKCRVLEDREREYQVSIARGKREPH
jgi:tRNA (mo5U34)-methyltransferase